MEVGRYDGSDPPTFNISAERCRKQERDRAGKDRRERGAEGRKSALALRECATDLARRTYRSCDEQRSCQSGAKRFGSVPPVRQHEKLTLASPRTAVGAAVS